jgi:hypothetical protein
VTPSKVPGPNLGTVTVGGTVVEKQDQTANVATTWTSATALNTTTATYAATGYGTANVAVRVPTTTTAGAITIEVSQDGTDWVPAGAVRQDNSFPENPVPLAYFPGVNGTRIYALSIDAFTLVRVRLSTVIVGAGNVVVTISAVAGGIEPIVATRPRKAAATYIAVFRTATALPWTLSAALSTTPKQFVTIHHAATATKTVKIRRVDLIPSNNSAAGDVIIDLVRITSAPATGNPAVTPSPANPGSAAAEATCLALPTTGGTAGALYGMQHLWLGITGAAPTTNPIPAPPRDPLYQWNSDGETDEPTIRAGVLEGYAVTLSSQVATTFQCYIIVEFTEEGP